MTDRPHMQEKYISQIPALQVMVNLGWDYLPPEEALRLRGGKRSSVLLTEVLRDWLGRHNLIRYRGQEHEFTQPNLHEAVRQLTDERFDRLVRTNEKLYDLLTLGTTLPQSVDGDTKSWPLRYIDWDRPERNMFHVTAEFPVTRTPTATPAASGGASGGGGGVSGGEHRRPDIVGFVNGIPLLVIECKSPTTPAPGSMGGTSGGGGPVEQAVSQMIRNQKVHEIPRLFAFAQVLMAVSKNEAKYATVGTEKKFWGVWKERNEDEERLRALVNRPLGDDVRARLFSGEFAGARTWFDDLTAGGREVTPQDRSIAALCEPARLLELASRYILFDSGEKKIARYQQYFAVRKIVERVKRNLTREAEDPHPGTPPGPPGIPGPPENPRRGGVVWHTQGSGKSLTMVMLAKVLALELRDEALRIGGDTGFKIVLVTDRVDLDEQIYGTFRNCGTEAKRATTGRQLGELLTDHKSRIVTTVIDKFEAATALGAKGRNPSANIFVLVDEGHRGQYGELHTKMKRTLPNACFLAFTGTPVLKQEKNTINRFGGLIDTYTIRQAVEDQAVVPLLYEGRYVDQRVDGDPLDVWFEKMTRGLSREDRAEIKKRLARAGTLYRNEQFIKAVAWNVGEHFAGTWQGTPYKAQLVAPSKAAAVLYKRFLDEFGVVSSEVLISPPDQREGHEDVNEVEADLDRVQAFWSRMMSKHGDESSYQRNIIDGFKGSERPEIIIVVHKLLTGFDAPRNTVLYLARPIQGHNLLQAIARVNRLFEGKEYGYVVDYVGVLKKLDQALDVYGSLPEFDAEDLKEFESALRDVAAEVQKLPQTHADLLEVFKEVGNRRDEEAYERLLADDAKRTRFYERLSRFARTLQMALSTVCFHEQTPAKQVQRYKDDLKFFSALRTAVRRRYDETVDFREYEHRVRKLLDTHVGAGEVEQVVEPLNIFETERMSQQLEVMGSAASKADAIAHATKRTIHDKMQEDPAFYARLSMMLTETIEAFRAKRLADADYLHQAKELRDAVVNRTGDDLPQELRQEDVAKAYYGRIYDVFSKHDSNGLDQKHAAAKASLAVDGIVLKHRAVDWGNNIDVQNRMKTEIEDYLFTLKDEGLDLALEDIDFILDEAIAIAKVRRP